MSTDNISKLAVIHIDEIIEVSEESNPYYSNDNSHGWMDKNGWLHRTANIINAKNGSIYEITIDIPKTNDGRALLYATKGKIKKVGQTDVKSLKIKASRSHSNFETIISHPNQKSNNNSEKSDIKKSERIIDDAANHFGTTYSWKETGYLLTDGRRLDFSGRKFSSNARYRTIDHREILDGFSEEDQELFESGYEAMVHFMQQGNIRIMPESDGINLSVLPTKAQETKLSEFIARAHAEVILDIDDERGNTVVSVEYPYGTKSS